MKIYANRKANARRWGEGVDNSSTRHWEEEKERERDEVKRYAMKDFSLVSSALGRLFCLVGRMDSCVRFRCPKCLSCFLQMINCVLFCIVLRWWWFRSLLACKILLLMCCCCCLHFFWTRSFFHDLQTPDTWQFHHHQVFLVIWSNILLLNATWR